MSGGFSVTVITHSKGEKMSVKISDIMAKRVIVIQKHHTVSHARQLMERNRISALPVVGPDHEAIGIVTSTDLARRLKDGTACGRIMSGAIRTVPAYNNVSVAARIMRKNKIHHVIVTHEKKVVGIVSSLDLLKLVEGKRFELKQAPISSKKKKKTRS